jgi:hypothetical protein
MFLMITGMGSKRYKQARGGYFLNRGCWAAGSVSAQGIFLSNANQKLHKSGMVPYHVTYNELDFRQKIEMSTGFLVG